MILLLLLGCTRVIEYACEVEDREDVATDELLDLGYTPADLLARVQGAEALDAIDLFGGPVPLTLTLERSEGPVQLRDTTVTEEVVSGVGPNEGAANVLTGCEDVVSVPVSVDLRTEDGAVAASGLGTLRNVPDEVENGRLAEVVLPWDAAQVLPEGLHGAPVGGRVTISYQGDRVTRLEAVVTTADDVAETVVWYQR